MESRELATLLNEGSDKHKFTAERRLLAAVLIRAFRDCTGPDALLARRALYWACSDTAGESDRSVFSFSWICRQLELNRETVLSRMLEMCGAEKAGSLEEEQQSNPIKKFF